MSNLITKTKPTTCSCPEKLGIFGQPIKGFDRHDLENSKQYLGRLRGIGRRRRWSFNNGKYDNHHPNRYYGVRSTAFENLHAVRGYNNRNQGVFLDAGCGESADADIALITGYNKSYAIDLFEPLNEFVRFKANFMLGDICEKLPIKSGSVDAISCSFVVPLMCQEDRLLFYKQAYRMLKKGGYLSVAGDILSSGYNHSEEQKGFRQSYFMMAKEETRLKKAGFKLIYKTANCRVVRKVT